MATLPADRSKLSIARQNQVAGKTAASKANIDAMTEAYDTIDLLNQKVDDHLANPTIPDGSVTTPKLANSSVTNQKIANGTITANKFVPGALTNDSQNGLRITQLEESLGTAAYKNADDLTTQGLNTMYVPSKLLPTILQGASDHFIILGPDDNSTWVVSGVFAGFRTNILIHAYRFDVGLFYNQGDVKGSVTVSEADNSTNIHPKYEFAKIKVSGTDFIALKIYASPGGSRSVRRAFFTGFADHADMMDIVLAEEVTTDTPIANDGVQHYFNGELSVGGNVVWHEGNSGPFFKGEGSPEGSVAAPIGSIYQRTDGGASTTLYVKESGPGNTGWKAVQTA